MKPTQASQSAAWPILVSKRQTRTTLASFNWDLGLRTVFDTVCGPVGVFFSPIASDRF